MYLVCGGFTCCFHYNTLCYNIHFPYAANNEARTIIIYNLQRSVTTILRQKITFRSIKPPHFNLIGSSSHWSTV
jgi:hypothetical protein